MGWKGNPWKRGDAQALAAPAELWAPLASLAAVPGHCFAPAPFPCQHPNLRQLSRELSPAPLPDPPSCRLEHWELKTHLELKKKIKWKFIFHPVLKSGGKPQGRQHTAQGALSIVH